MLFGCEHVVFLSIISIINLKVNVISKLRLCHGEKFIFCRFGSFFSFSNHNATWAMNQLSAIAFSSRFPIYAFNKCFNDSTCQIYSNDGIE